MPAILTITVFSRTPVTHTYSAQQNQSWVWFWVTLTKSIRHSRTHDIGSGGKFFVRAIIWEASWSKNEGGEEDFMYPFWFPRLIIRYCQLGFFVWALLVVFHIPVRSKKHTHYRHHHYPFPAYEYKTLTSRFPGNLLAQRTPYHVRSLLFGGFLNSGEIQERENSNEQRLRGFIYPLPIRWIRRTGVRCGF
jgi:hypothetical protein